MPPVVAGGMFALCKLVDQEKSLHKANTGQNSRKVKAMQCESVEPWLSAIRASRQGEAFTGKAGRHGAPCRPAPKFVNEEVLIPAPGIAYREVWSSHFSGPIYLRVTVNERVAEIAATAGATVARSQPRSMSRPEILRAVRG